MNIPNHFQRASSIFATALVSASVLLSPAQLFAQAEKAAAPGKLFSSPDEATSALRKAAEAGDRAAVNEIFGPDAKSLLTGDAVQDKAHFAGFSRAMTAACVQEPDGDNRIILNIGTNQWPFPIPLVKTNGQWFFDTAAGKEEIINRHIGRDELNAIGVCRAYVTAQQQYYSSDHDGSGSQKYALKFKSTPGKQDGLYWHSTNEPSPFSELMADAHAEGYHEKGTGPHPFHGYYFKVLTSQGDAAPGGKTNYLANGSLTGGFALVAYPEKWDKSGIMTFIVSKDGKVYQRNLAEKTGRIAARMTAYNPGENWKVVSDSGVVEQ